MRYNPAMTAYLNRRLQETVDANDGLPVEVPGEMRNYVVMSRDVFCKAFGVPDGDETRAAIDRGLADVRAGRVRPLEDVLRDLQRRL